jgi:hypothetical protein
MADHEYAASGETFPAALHLERGGSVQDAKTADLRAQLAAEAASPPQEAPAEVEVLHEEVDPVVADEVPAEDLGEVSEGGE